MNTTLALNEIDTQQTALVPVNESSTPIFDKNSVADRKSNEELLRGRLQEHDSELRCHKIDPQVLRIQDGYLEAGTKRFELSASGTEQLCNQVNAPSQYLKKLGSDLQYDCLNRHLERGDHVPNWTKDTPDKSKKLLLFERDGTFRGCGRADHLSLRGVDVLDTVYEACDSLGMLGTFTCHRLDIDHETWSIDLTTPKREGQVRVGDTIRSGLRITFCPLGTTATSIESYFHRLVCSNGMTKRECTSKGTSRIRRVPSFQPDATTAYLSQIYRLAITTLTGLEAKLESMNSLTADQVDREHYLNNLLSRQPRLRSKNLIERILHVWEQEEDADESTAYGAMNAMTYLATHNPPLPELKKSRMLCPGTRQMLQRLAGIMATQSLHICPKCFSLVSAA